MDKHVAVRRFGISLLVAGAALLLPSVASADGLTASLLQSTVLAHTMHVPRFSTANRVPHALRNTPDINRQAMRAPSRSAPSRSH